MKPHQFLRLTFLMSITLVVLLIPADHTRASIGHSNTLVSGTNSRTCISTIYGDLADGEVLNRWCASEWDTCRNAPSGNATWQDLTVGTIGATLEQDGTYTIQRIFLFFDTSSIPTNAQVTQVTLFFYAGRFQNGDKTVHVTRSMASLPLSNEDFSEIEYISGGSTRPPITDMWASIHLDKNALGWISRGGMTRLALVHDLDLRNIEPQVANDILVGLAEEPEFRPFLIVSYKAAPPSNILFLPSVLRK